MVCLGNSNQLDMSVTEAAGKREVSERGNQGPGYKNLIRCAKEFGVYSV